MKVLKILAIIIGSFVLLFVFLAIMAGIFGSDTDTDSVEKSEGATLVVEPTNEATEEIVPEEPISPWSYTEETDEMDSTKRYFASTRSINELDFEFPYNGGSFGTLFIRNMKNRNEVILRISKGQFMNAHNSKLRIKFDDSAPVTYSFSEPDDYSSDYIFISNATGFIAKLKNVKLLKIEAPFFNEGKKVLDFVVRDLEWNK